MAFSQNSTDAPHQADTRSGSLWSNVRITRSREFIAPPNGIILLVAQSFLSAEHELYNTGIVLQAGRPTGEKTLDPLC
ncbi:MAG: hypothetical protein GX594_14920 [Pirellulaceae bacterium]|nr:hypothetical protein [Pirellulaceae bacterium]